MWDGSSVDIRVARKEEGGKQNGAVVAEGCGGGGDSGGVMENLEFERIMG